MALVAMHAGPTGGVLASPAAAAPTLTVTPSAAPPGGSVTLPGVGFVPNVAVSPVIQNGPVAFSALQNCRVDASGTLDCTRTIPTSQAALRTAADQHRGYTEQRVHAGVVRGLIAADGYADLDLDHNADALPVSVTAISGAEGMDSCGRPAGRFRIKVANLEYFG